MPSHRSSAQVSYLLPHAQSDRLLLGRLGKVGLQGSAEEVAQDSFRHIVDLLQRLLRSGKRGQANELYSLSEFRKILNGLLNLLQAIANGIGRVYDFEDLRLSVGAFSRRTWVRTAKPSEFSCNR